MVPSDCTSRKTLEKKTLNFILCYPHGGVKRCAAYVALSLDVTFAVAAYAAVIVVVENVLLK